MSRGNKTPHKDMYWFAHGGPESEKLQRNSALFDGEEDVHASNSTTWNSQAEHRASPDEQRTSHSVTDGSNHSSGPPSLEKDDRIRISDKRTAVEERRKQLWEAEQERNDAVLRKHMERDAALEARRNASRSTIAFAFGSSIPRNVDSIQANDVGDGDIMSRSFTSGSSQREETHNTFNDRSSVSPFSYNQPSISSQSHSSYSEQKVLSPPSCLFGSGALIGEDLMSKSMTASISSAPRGRRKNDLMPTVPYDRTATPRVATSSSTRKRSVSMTRLDQLALPRKHYVEANKASSNVSSANSSMLKDNVHSPNRPLSSASENSGGSGRVSSSVTRRVRSSPRKPRPVSIAGTLPEQRQIKSSKPFEVKVSPSKRSYTPSKQSSTPQSTFKNVTPKSVEKVKQAPRLSTPPKMSTLKPSTPKTSAPKPATPKSAKQTESKLTAAKSAPSPKTPSSKVKEKKSLPIKKKLDLVTNSQIAGEAKNQSDEGEKIESPPPGIDSDVAAENEKNNAKRIISEEEARAALAEKRRLAREQAEREAELERQRQEELRLEEEERLRKEEEDHRKMEEEQMRLLDEHRRQEEEKLRKAIEDQEQKEEEERIKRDEEMRMKAEQEKKAKDEAEKQRLELEEKLRKEEDERAERKKRLEKIMSRTRGKSSGTSPSGSVSGSDQLDSGENNQEGFSSGANSLDSNEGAELPSEQASIEDHKAEILSVGESGDSLEAHPTYEINSENESLNSNDLMMPASETASQENSLVIIPNKDLADTLTSSETPAFENSHLTGSKIEESLNTNSSGNTNNPLVEDIQEAYKISMNAKPADSSKIDVSLIQSDSHLETREIIDDGADAMAVSELPVADYSNENLPLVESNLHGDAENQQYLDDPDLLKLVPEVAASQEQFNTVSETQLQHEADFKSSSFTQHFNDVNVDAAASGIFESSSDFKLPDPLYETSEDGSVSSEKQQTFGMQEGFNYTRNQDNIADDVFSQSIILPDPVNVSSEKNPFEMNAFEAKQNLFSDDYSFHQSDIDLNGSSSSDMMGSFIETKVSNEFNKVDVTSEGFEVSSSIVEADVHESGLVIQEENPNKQEKVSAEIVSDSSVLKQSADVEEIFLKNAISASFDQEVDFHQNLHQDDIHLDAEEKPFFDNRFHGDSDSSTLTFDQVVTEAHSGTESFQQQEVDDVTFIKASDSGACIGIISSIDHDQISNNFSKPGILSGQLKTNYESASMTDSEDNSSLDSNLSQVMTIENLNPAEVSAPNKNGFSNGEKHNPFDMEDVYNDSPSKAVVNNFHESEIFNNGHRFESSTSAPEQINELHDYVQLGGNGILSVDHSKNNIFESADASNFGKVSPDPFLVKGNSNQISGNPFLLQDDQKQVLRTPDFFN